MKKWLSFGCVGVVVAACTTADPNAPVDAGQDADHDAQALDSGSDASDSASPADATRDAPADAADSSVLDASDAGEPADASDAGEPVDASDAGDAGERDASDAGDAGDAGTPDALLLPSENDVPYRMRAVCTIKPVNRVGTAQSCCRQSSYTTETLCDTEVHERRDVAGNLVLVVDPMQGCATVISGDSCTRTGTLSRCDSAGLTCPFTLLTPGSPTVLAATYTRRTVGVGATVTLADHYWTGCSTAGMVPITNPSCSTSPGTVVQASTTRMTTVAKSAAGELTLRSTWTSNPQPGTCTSPSFPPARPTLDSASFVSGASGMGGSFSIAGYTCSYVLTKK